MQRSLCIASSNFHSNFHAIERECIRIKDKSHHIKPSSSNNGTCHCAIRGTMSTTTEHHPMSIDQGNTSVPVVMQRLSKWKRTYNMTQWPPEMPTDIYPSWKDWLMTPFIMFSVGPNFLRVGCVRNHWTWKFSENDFPPEWRRESNGWKQVWRKRKTS
jgi:hypothetical protein